VTGILQAIFGPVTPHKNADKMPALQPQTGQFGTILRVA